MFYYNRIHLSEGIYIAKSNNSKNCMACCDSFFNHGCKFQDSVCNAVCNGCLDLTMLCLNLTDIAIITFRNVEYRCIIYNITKSDVINLLENSVFNDRGYI